MTRSVDAAKWLLLRKNWLLFCVVGLGTPSSLVAVLLLGDDGGPLFSGFLTLVAYAGSYAWGRLMWTLYLEPRVPRQ
jgi:hypothetical protein